MILILCENYRSASDAFSYFMKFLNKTEPWVIVSYEPYANLVKTEFDLTYIFIDRNYAAIYQYFKPDLVEETIFFEDLYDSSIY